MSGATKIRGELQAGTSGNMDSSAMETEEYYNPEGGEWSQKMDTVQLCRVCANPNEYLIPIFEGEGLEHKLSLKIEKHLPIKVTETDTLPQHMCYQCASTLIAWHDLVISCVEADKKLKELQADEDDNDDDKGTEMFESHSMDSEPADEVDQPSTSETQSEMTAKLQVPRKTTTSKDKKPKLKMVLVKGGTSGQKTVAKSQVAKALELAKSKEGGNEDSASERCNDSPSKIEGEMKLYVVEIAPLMLNSEENDLFVSEEFKNEIFGDNLSAEKVFCKTKELKNVLPSPHGLTKRTSEHELVQVTDMIKQAVLDVATTTGEKLESFPGDICLPQTTLERSFNYCETNIPQIQESRKENIPDLSNKPEKFIKETPDGVISVYSCSACDEDFLSFAELTSHMKYHIPEKGNKEYVCKVCNNKFTNASAFKWHIKIHTDDPIKCDICDQDFKNHSMLLLHKLTHAAKNPHPCQHCNRKFVLASSLEQHLILDHKDRIKFLCRNCNKILPSKLELKSHVKEMHTAPFMSNVDTEISEYLCSVCGCIFDSVRKLKAHERSVHEGRYKKSKEGNPNNMFICEVCGETFRFNALLKTHTLIHEKKKKVAYTCNICGVVRKNKWLLQQHLGSHNSRNYICKFCNAGFRTAKMAETHENKHYRNVSIAQDVEKSSVNFVCTYCSKVFNSKMKLDIHVKMHTGDRPFQCKKCNKSFSSRKVLLMHVSIKHKEIKMYACHICDKSFASKPSRNKHLNIHTGERPFKCQICCRAFAHKGGLAQHMLQHTGMMYSCNLCGIAFHQEHQYKIHIRKHVGEKSNTCDICGRSFAQCSDLEKHKQKIHDVK